MLGAKGVSKTNFWPCKYRRGGQRYLIILGRQKVNTVGAVHDHCNSALIKPECMYWTMSCIDTAF